MSDAVMSTWLKIVLGLIALVVIATGAILIFRDNIFSFFKNLAPATSFLPLVK